jgi:hypothetical protein
LYRQIILASFCLLCYADNGIYQYTDKNGNLVLSNKPKTSNTRYKVLSEELAHEKQALIKANESLATSSPKQEDFLKNTIKAHQKNIDILNKQLGYTP